MNKYQEALNFLDWHCEVAHVEQQDLLQELIDKHKRIEEVHNLIYTLATNEEQKALIYAINVLLLEIERDWELNTPGTTVKVPKIEYGSD